MDSGFRNTKQHRNAAGITAGLAILLIVLVTILQHDVFKHGLIEIVLFVVVIVAVTLVRVLDLFSINKHPAIFLAIYHGIFIYAQIFVLAPFHPMSFLWLLLLIRTHSYLGPRWAIGWWAAFSSASFLGLLLVDNVSNEQAYFVIFSVIISAILNFTLEDTIRQQQGFQEERDFKIEESQHLQKRLESIFNNIQVAIFGIDQEGKIAVYNQAALAIINQNAELHGLHIDDVLGLSDDKGELIRIKNIMKTESQVDRTDAYLHLGVIERMPVHLVVTKFAQSYNIRDKVRFVLTLRDLSKERKLNQGHSDFISMVSHELRTPITIAEGQVSNALLLAEKMENNQPIIESLNVAHDQVQHLSEMINEVSTISQAERDELSGLKLQRIDPAELVREVVANHTKQAQDSQLQLNLDIQNDIETIITSRHYIIDILNNLIDNAVKYTEEGSVTVGVDSENNQVRFFVKDTGIGISHSDGPNIFNKFFRAADIKTQKHNGTGLGLYLSKQLARRINAKLDFESTVGVGSEFSLHVPRIGALKRDAKEVSETEVNEFMHDV